MTVMRKNTRRLQGMTEYILLVGLVALGLIAAVSMYGFRVDEAIQGSKNAWEKRNPPDPSWTRGSEKHKVKTTDKNYDVYRFNDGDKWVYKAFPSPASNPTIDGGQPYNKGTHGEVPGL